MKDNIVIAKFLNWKVWKLDDDELLYEIPSNFKVIDNVTGDYIALYSHEMRFHSSFDWLLPVIQKINDCGCIIDMSFSIVPDFRICYIGKKGEPAINFYSENDDFIINVWETIIKFIKWYNEMGKN